MTINEYLPKIVDMLRTLIPASPLFPYDRTTKKRKPNKPHIRDYMFSGNYAVMVSPNMYVFDYGDSEAERLVPHYHILEDAKTIRNPGKGTKLTKGSQRLISDRSKRDYSVTTTNKEGVIFQEYRQGFKPGRRNYDVINARITAKRDRQKPQSKEVFRYNVHYAYLERILQQVTPFIANNLGLTLVSHRGLIEPITESGE